MTSDDKQKKAQYLAHVKAALSLLEYNVDIEFRRALFAYYKTLPGLKLADYMKLRDEFVEEATLDLGSDQQRCASVLRSILTQLEEG